MNAVCVSCSDRERPIPGWFCFDIENAYLKYALGMRIAQAAEEVAFSAALPISSQTLV